MVQWGAGEPSSPDFLPFGCLWRSSGVEDDESGSERGEDSPCCRWLWRRGVWAAGCMASKTWGRPLAYSQQETRDLSVATIRNWILPTAQGNRKRISPVSRKKQGLLTPRPMVWWHLHQTSNLQNWKVINPGVFKLLGLWHFDMTERQIIQRYGSLLLF